MAVPTTPADVPQPRNTAVPQPIRVRTSVPMNSAKYFFITVGFKWLLFCFFQFNFKHLWPVLAGEVNFTVGRVVGYSVQDIGARGAQGTVQKPAAVDGSLYLSGLGIDYHYGISGVDVGPDLSVYPFKLV